MPIKKLLVVGITIVLFAAALFAPPLTIAEDQLDKLNKDIADLTDALNKSVAATKPLESQLTSMQTQITGIKQQVAFIEQDIAHKKVEIDNGYQTLLEKETLLNQTVRKYYIESYYDSPLVTLLSGTTASEITQALAYQRAKTNQDKALMATIASSISEIEAKKANLESEQTRLVAIKATLDQQSSKLDEVVKGAKAYQSKLSSQIAALTAQQQQFIAQKQGSLNIPQSAYTTQGGCSSDLTNGKDPGFSPRFGLFSFGVPNRVGLNQYGAKGRAEAGQSAETILSAYYQDYNLDKGYNTGINIHVTGTNEYGQSFDTNWDIETYVKHIYEIPTNWSMEALKAQAIAARSYALAYTDNGNRTICPSQSCQVVKQEINSDAWQQAVDATRGWVMVSG